MRYSILLYSTNNLCYVTHTAYFLDSLFLFLVASCALNLQTKRNTIRTYLGSLKMFNVQFADHYGYENTLLREIKYILENSMSRKDNYRK